MQTPPQFDEHLSSSNTDYLNELNKIQRAAVETINGPVMIIAGPGSGKTRVLTYRIAHLINQGVKPYNILSLTFTNKAAREMKERIEEIVGPVAAQQLYMGTFHSVFARILRIEAETIGYPANFSIYDTQDAKNLLKNIIIEQNLNPDHYKVNVVYSRISNAKNNLLTPIAYNKHTAVVANDAASNLSKMGKLYQLYWNRCKQAGAMDFDDLLLNMFYLVQKSPATLEKYQKRFKYLMIDEFQDTNTAQYAIVKKLASLSKNICVVGDDAQSIYAFRGATIQNILNFEQDYVNLKTFKLEQNYRSSKKIIAIANEIIATNKDQIDKTIWTNNPDGVKVQLFITASESEEAKVVAYRIAEECLRYHYQHEEIALLYRTNAQSRVLEEALRKQNIPYKIFGGLSFYQRKEVKDLMGYLRLTVNLHDEEALRRVLNYPKRGIGNTTIKKVATWAQEKEVPLWTILDKIKLFPLAKRAKEEITKFVNLIKVYRSMEKKKDAYELAKYIGRTSGLLPLLHNDKSVEGLSRYENIEELFNSIKEFVDDRREIARSDSEIEDENNLAYLGTYLQEVSLLTSMDDEKEDTNKVSLMTVHSAKGLEFKSVYIVGLEENLFPSARSSKTQKDIEEERRLFYVAVTRAKERLHLSYAINRYKFGEVSHNEPSRFISELSPLHFETIGGRSKSSNVFMKNDAFDSFQDSPKNSIKGNIQNARKLAQQKQNLSKESLFSDFKASKISDIKEGLTVAHQRFGYGKVLQVEGIGKKRQALIKFEIQGEKRILLSYAKLMVIYY